MGSLVYTGWIGGVRCMMCGLRFVPFLRSFTTIGIVLFGSVHQHHIFTLLLSSSKKPVFFFLHFDPFLLVYVFGMCCSFIHNLWYLSMSTYLLFFSFFLRCMAQGAPHRVRQVFVVAVIHTLHKKKDKPTLLQKRRPPQPPDTTY